MFRTWLEAKISRAAAKDLLKSAIDTPIAISFVKKNGEVRNMRAMYGVDPENPSGTGMSYDPESRGLVLVNDVDVANEKGTDAAFRSVPIKRLLTIDDDLEVDED